MKWRPIGNHTYESDTGHTILRCTANGVPTGRFIAFRGRTTGEGMPEVLGGKDNLDDAIELCKRDAATQQAAA